MTNVTQPFVTPPPKGILDPRTGRPIGADDPSFRTLNNELADKDFLVTATDELITWARTGSLMWMTFGLACCAIEMMQISPGPRPNTGSTRPQAAQGRSAWVPPLSAPVRARIFHSEAAFPQYCFKKPNYFVLAMLLLPAFLESCVRTGRSERSSVRKAMSAGNGEP